eukprot:scaffold3005_cov109-Isochrysis_galbana.AAC.7
MPPTTSASTASSATLRPISITTCPDSVRDESSAASGVRPDIASSSNPSNARYQANAKGSGVAPARWPDRWLMYEPRKADGGLVTTCLLLGGRKAVSTAGSVKTTAAPSAMPKQPRRTSWLYEELGLSGSSRSCGSTYVRCNDITTWPTKPFHIHPVST